ncbi:MAG TPA: GNAT family N-acetyltransferase [Feifaniaceae bacterium]|nr:GNAT family N-acetyltransferase [Feifaniaceae bacterium]
MISYRALTQADKRQAMEIWELRFHDSLSFIDWYFRARFSPETSFCAEQDGRIVSIAHGSSMNLRIRGQVFPAMMVSGVATMPGFEGKGIMKRVMFELFDHCRAEKIPLAFHTPSHFSIYRQLGEFPCAGALLYTRETPPSSPPVWDEVPTASELLSVYERATARYSGCVVRSVLQMQSRIEDLLCDGGRCMTFHENGKLAGYLFASQQDDGFHCEEALAVSEEAYQALLSRLPLGTAVKLPPDANCSGKLYPQGVVIPIDVPYLLDALCGNPDALHLEVFDETLPWNNGVFDGAGNRVSGSSPGFLSAGRLMQFLCGYLPFRDVFSQQVCYCADEY